MMHRPDRLHAPRRGRRVAVAFAAFACAVTLGSTAGAAADRVDPRLRRSLAALDSRPTVAAWVVFADKGAAALSPGVRATNLVSERSLQRRLRVRPAGQAVDAADLPLDERYVGAVARTGAHVRHRSKWFNRVSVDATPAQIEALAGLDCVRSVEPLLRFRRGAGDGISEGMLAEPEAAPAKPAPLLGLDYGLSFDQLAMMGVTTLHAQGITGTNVLVGHFDNGYRLLSHQVLAATQIVAAHDFVDGDSDPAPPDGSPAGWGAHGIATLSVLGGYAPGELIGAAFGAQYVIARTEADGSETPLEEDNWVAAIEWADSLGIDVASTSLGYLSFDEPFTSWTWEDMNGATTIITRAADRAAQLGIVVVNSAGNAGLDTHNTLLAPADGDSVIAVGAVDPSLVRSSFSSVGPTTDVPPRIKPDVMAQGRSVHVAGTSGTNVYGNSSGTSFSCPLVAGVAALLLSAHPAATPMQIRDALRLTASQATSPDALMGWGIVDAVAAHDWLSATDVVMAPPRANALTSFPNPFNPATTISWRLDRPAFVTLRIYDPRGRLVRTLASRTGTVHSALWDGRDESGHTLPSGVYLCRLHASEAGRTVATLNRKLTLVE